MTCAEFQKVLPYIIETGGNAEEERHLRDCPVCSDLVADLKYIAEQAKLLVPMEDPSPRVWEGIRGSLEREGLVRPARARGRLLRFPGSSSTFPWIGIAVAVLLVVFAGLLYQRGRVRPEAVPVPEQASLAPATRLPQVEVPSEQADQQLLSRMAEARPAMASSYASNLKQVNASISDARQAVQRDPDDADARLSLIKAYEQKAMLYDMATQALQ